MQPSETVTTINPQPRQHPEQIASWGWLMGFLLIGAGTVLLGFLAQHAPAATGAASSQLADHGHAIQIYLTVAAMDWALLYYCWAGVHRSGGNLETLSGGRWTSWKALAIDLAIALPFWVLWEGAAYGVHWLLGASSAKTVNSLLPTTPLEIIIWVGVSITAGICEELAFRGFLQRQLHAFTGNLSLAVLAQGLVFGLFHAYQGWKNVVVITLLGVLFGALAAWRRNLRTNVIVHAWADIWGGWLQLVIFE
jgi:membrane protease YdiL (CAAX protease family)